MGFRLKRHLNPHFIAISVMTSCHHWSPDDRIYGQDIFKTLFQSPNHELGITRQTLYRHISPDGTLRPDGEKLLSRI